MATKPGQVRVPDLAATPTLRLVDRILVPVAGTDAEFLAHHWAVGLAHLLQVRVRAIHVTPPGRDAPPDVFGYLEKEAEKWNVELKTASTSGEDVVEEIVKEAGALDLIVVGTKRLANGYHVGSVAGQLLKRAPCPVQMVRLV